jgi:hypothetical protein
MGVNKESGRIQFTAEGDKQMIPECPQCRKTKAKLIDVIMAYRNTASMGGTIPIWQCPCGMVYQGRSGTMVTNLNRFMTHDEGYGQLVRRMEGELKKDWEADVDPVEAARRRVQKFKIED